MTRAGDEARHPNSVARSDQCIGSALSVADGAVGAGNDPCQLSSWRAAESRPQEAIAPSTLGAYATTAAVI